MRKGKGAPPIRLGINIDHVATLRNARGAAHPDPLRAAEIAVEAGADNITAHLREDRRHIRDEDIARLTAAALAPLNLEMAVTEEMLAIARGARPHACCLVPERRQELTTEGGLDAASQVKKLEPFVAKLQDTGIHVALFIDPDAVQVEASRVVGADAVEFHTGTYCGAAAAGDRAAQARELQRIAEAARLAASMGIEVHAGHGLDYHNVMPVAAIPEIVELNIGHYLVGEAIFVGLGESVRRMKAIMQNARLGPSQPKAKATRARARAGAAR